MAAETRDHAPKSCELQQELQTEVYEEEQTIDVVDPELVRELTAVTAVARPQRPDADQELTGQASPRAAATAPYPRVLPRGPAALPIATVPESLADVVTEAPAAAHLGRQAPAVTETLSPDPTIEQATELRHATARPLASTATGGEEAYWEARAHRLQQELEAASSSRRGALLLYELGRIYETRLGRPEIALGCYRESHGRFSGLMVNARALGRLLQARGDHEGYLEVLEAELGACSSAAERCAVLVERADLRLHCLDDPEGARSDLVRALDIDPADPVANATLADVYRRLGAHGELEQLLRRQLLGCEEPAVRSALLCEIGRLREEWLGDLQEAASFYRTALNTLPTNILAVRALLRTARAVRDYPAVAKLCDSLAEVDRDAQEAYLWEAARIYAGRLRNTELAIKALERSCELTEDLALLLDLAVLYERDKRWEELAATLQRALVLAGDPREAAGLGYRLAQVQLQRMQQPDEAIGTLSAALEAWPDHLPARRMLGRLYSRSKRWEDLIRLLEQQHDLFVDDACRGVTLYRIGHLLERTVEDLPRAAETYEHALARLPGYRPAVQGLGRVYAALERYEDLVVVFEREVAQSPDRSDKAALLWRIAETWERRLNDPSAAVAAYERLLALDPANASALRALRRIYSVGQAWKDLVDVLRTEAGHSGDRHLRIALLDEIAEVQERRLDDEDAALQTQLEILEHSQRHQPALMAAGRLLKARGAHEQLVALHRRELAVCDDVDHRGWLLLKIARIQLDELGEPDEAIAALEEATRLDPSPAAALDQLIWLRRRRKEFGELFELLTKQPLPESPAARSLHHRQIAEVLQHSQRPALAVEHLRRALTASDDDAAVQLLGRLYLAIEDRQSLIKLHQLAIARTEDPHARFSAHHKLARLYAAADHDLDHAVDALDRLLQQAPRDRVILRQLEWLLCRLARWEEVVAVLELARETSDDEDYRQACALMMSGLREDRLDDLTGAAQSAVEVLARDQTNGEALATLERYYRDSGNAEGLGQVHSRQVRLAQTVAEQTALLSAVAAIHARAGDLHQAVEVYRLAVERTPTWLPAILGWQRAAREQGRWQELAEALEHEAVATLDPEREAYCHYEAGRLWQSRLDDSQRAVDAYRRALEVQPDHQDATSALSALHTARQDFVQLVELLMHAADQHHGNPCTRRDLLARAANIQHSRLQDLVAARTTISLALETAPDDQPLLATLAEYCRLSQDFEALARVNQHLVHLTEDPVLLKALHFELGLLWEEKLDDTDRAIREYRNVLGLDRNDLGALTRLSKLLLLQEDWLPAAQTTEMLIARDDDRNRVREYHLRLSRIYAEGFGDLPGAIEACRRALALDPGDLQATEQMAVLLAEAGDLRAMHAHLESTLNVHRARIDQDPFRVQSHHALLRVFAHQRAPDRSFVVCSLLAALGAAGSKERAFYEDRCQLAPREPRRALTDDEVERLLVHADERGALRQLLTHAEVALRKVFPPVERSVLKPTKVTNRSAPELALTLRNLNRAMGGDNFSAFVVDDSRRELWIEDTSTPSLFVARPVCERLENPELRFRIARAVGHLRLRHTLASRLGAEGLEEVVAALLSLLCASYSPRTEGSQLEALVNKLDRSLPRRSRAALESPCLELADRPLDPARWLAAMIRSEDRIALAVCGDLPAAIRTLLHEERTPAMTRRPETLEQISAVAGPRLRQLLCFAVSDEHLTLRERLGLAIT